MAEPRRITVTVDRLVLHGVDPRDRAAVARALEASLSTALSDAGLPGVAAINAAGLTARIPNPPARGPAALGRAAGKAVHAAIAGGQRGSRR